MRRVLLFFGVLVLFSLGSCHTDLDRNVLVSREFPTGSWERFDYVENVITLDKPVSYDLNLEAVFDDSYTFNYFAMVFTLFDQAGNPLRSKNYKFSIKDRNGSWKSESTDGLYHFCFPLNNELSINEPGTYKFQIENHMPITPLIGIREISIINK